MTESKARQQALELGAVKVGVYFTTRKRFAPHGQLEDCQEAFTSHYFNAEGLEVGYYNHVLYSPRLVQMDPARQWGPEALNIFGD